MNTMKNIIVAISFMVALLLQQSALAADKDATARMQFMIRQITAEKNQLAAENQKKLVEKLALEQEMKSLQKKYDALVKNAENKKTAMSGKIKDLRDGLSAERQAHQETMGQLSEMASEKGRLFNIATEQIHAIDLCVSNNKKLYELNREILGQYENKGVWGAITQAEPITGLSQVQIENLVDDYQYKLDDLRVEIKEADTQVSLGQ